jgi:chromosome partitioning protein
MQTSTSTSTTSPRTSPRTSARTTRSIAVLQQKGGVGKTTIATNLGAAAHLAGMKTLVFDLDKQGSAFDWFSARQPDSKLDGLAVVKADKPLSLEKIRSITEGYEVVIFDGPPRVSDMTRCAAVASDIVLLPLRAGPLDFWATDDILNVLDSADEIRAHFKMKPVERVFLLNGLPPRSKLTEQAKAALAELAKKLVRGRLSSCSLGSRVAFPTAMFNGESVLTIDVPGRAGSEVMRLFDSVMTSVMTNGKAVAA